MRSLLSFTCPLESFLPFSVPGTLWKVKSSHDNSAGWLQTSVTSLLLLSRYQLGQFSPQLKYFLDSSKPCPLAVNSSMPPPSSSAYNSSPHFLSTFCPVAETEQDLWEFWAWMQHHHFPTFPVNQKQLWPPAFLSSSSRFKQLLISEGRALPESRRRSQGNHSTAQ